MRSDTLRQGEVERAYGFVVAAGAGFSLAGALLMGLYGLWVVCIVLLGVAAFLSRAYRRGIFPGSNREDWSSGEI